MKLIEQFFNCGRVIVEMRKPDLGFLLGYCPERNLDSTIPYMYWPYFMNGKIFLTQIYESMITSGIDQFNHLHTFKKMVSGNYYKSYVEDEEKSSKERNTINS